LIDQFLMPIQGHVTSRLQLMLFGCTRAVCELKGIYNV